MSGVLLRIVLSTLFLALAGAAAECALRHLGRPLRGVWALTMAATIITTVLLMAGGSLPLPAPNAVAEVIALNYSDEMPGARTGGAQAPLETLFPIAWAALTALLLLALTLGTALQKKRLGSGVEWTIHGVMVLLTDRFGPAVAGVLRPVIVVPAWLLEMSPAHQRLVICHEAEHAAAGDQRLVAAALTLCCLLPWNPFVWFQLHRLRLAIEIDCDARVLRRQRGARGDYGMLLIDVAERMARGTPLATALVHPRNSLERRIHMITCSAKRPLYAAAWALGALVMVAGACMEPTEPPPASGEFQVSKSTFDSVETSPLLQPLKRGTAEATFTFRKQDFDGASSGNKHGIVRFEARVDAEGRATDIRFDPSTSADLQPLARQSIESVRVRREANAPADNWIPALITVPQP